MKNKEVIQKWVDALRSGEYGQVTGQLGIQDKGYCCLGVLCDLAAKEGVIPTPSLEGDTLVFNGAESFPPRSVEEWVGVVDGNWQVLAPEEMVEDGTYFEPGDRADLTDLNDTHYYSFASIADEIERTYLP